MLKETEAEETTGFLSLFVIGGISIGRGKEAGPWASLATPMVAAIAQLVKSRVSNRKSANSKFDSPWQCVVVLFGITTLISH